jgi:thiopurine S-methyltransferase
MTASEGSAAWWDQRYRDGRDGWELGAPAPPLQRFLTSDPLAPRPPAQVLVPGCGRGHEVALLADLGFQAIGLDISAAALDEAKRIYGPGGPALRWVQADCLDPEALQRFGLAPAGVDGLLEHTCFCAIHPDQRQAYLHAAAQLLRPGGWLLGLFWCHGRSGGPPYGSDPDQLATALEAAGFRPVLWQPASQSATGRDGQPRLDEWLGLWRRPP